MDAQTADIFGSLNGMPRRKALRPARCTRAESTRPDARAQPAVEHLRLGESHNAWRDAELSAKSSRKLARIGVADRLRHFSNAAPTAAQQVMGA